MKRKLLQRIRKSLNFLKVKLAKEGETFFIATILPMVGGGEENMFFLTHANVLFNFSITKTLSSLYHHHHHPSRDSFISFLLFVLVVASYVCMRMSRFANNNQQKGIASKVVHPNFHDNNIAMKKIENFWGEILIVLFEKQFKFSKLSFKQSFLFIYSNALEMASFY